jgi:hypothetical protein
VALIGGLLANQRESDGCVNDRTHLTPVHFHIHDVFLVHHSQWQIIERINLLLGFQGWLCCASGRRLFLIDEILQDIDIGGRSRRAWILRG